MRVRSTRPTSGPGTLPAKFADPQLSQLDLTSPSAIHELIEVHLCGHPTVSPLTRSVQQLLERFLRNAAPSGLTFAQLNELLLVLNQDRISLPFFKYFFCQSEHDSLPLTELRDSVIRLKGMSMLCFGNFRFAFRRLRRAASETEIRSLLGPLCRQKADLELMYEKRPKKLLDIETISRINTWYVGEITGSIVKAEISRFTELSTINSALKKDPKAVTFGKRLVDMDSEFTIVQDTALLNTDVYLTWDYIDIYVATSMRNRWEYEEVFDFTSQLFASPVLTPLNLRHFDPTQSKCRNARDKGLLEGLMLKRARCTIYMAQETDTLGKDSELATTLAQGKPVIAYVPEIDVDQFASTVASRPLRYMKLRLYDLQASGVVEQIDELPRLAQVFLEDLRQHREGQPFELWERRDEQDFKQKKDYWSDLCSKLAQAEKKAFDKRAEVLRRYHPLGMQLDLSTGVANGVMVVRRLESCANLLRAILTNATEFEINSEDGCRTLVESISRSVFRIVTDNEKLTNSFWNLYEEDVETSG